MVIMTKFDDNEKAGNKHKIKLVVAAVITIIPMITKCNTIPKG